MVNETHEGAGAEQPSSDETVDAAQIAVVSSAAVAHQHAPQPILWQQSTDQGNRFWLPDYYQFVRTLGSGAYGVVCHALDTRYASGDERRNVAIKKIGRAFEHAIDAKRTLREVKLLREMRHDNIITLLDILPPMQNDSFQDLYCVYQFMETDLHQIIRSAQPLSEDHVQYFTYQILRGLKYVHSLGVVHRDLKPSNLLLNGNCDLRIGDFGLARTLGPADDHQSFLTEYVATRWYRAPEVLLSWTRYTTALDMWSVGCIVAELLGRRPIFPGRNFQDQIERICAVLGNPSNEYLASVTSEHSCRYIKGLRVFQGQDLRAMYPPLSTAAEEVELHLKGIALLQGLLTFDPNARLTVQQALETEYLHGLHDPTDEPVATRTINSDWEQQLVDSGNTPEVRNQLRREAHEEIRRHYHKELPAWAGDARAKRGRDWE